MKILFVLLSLTLAQTQTGREESSGLEVLKLKVTETFKLYDRRPSMVSQKPPIIKPDPNANRGRDRNEPELVTIRDDLTQRINELRSVQQMQREEPYRAAAVAFYDSEAAFKNNTSKSVTGFVWAYRASPSLGYTKDQEFLCQIKIRPGKSMPVKVLARYPAQKVVNVSASTANTIPEKPSLKDIIINQVKFADGTVWQRSDWDPKVLSGRGARLVGDGKCGNLM